jgi:D-alanine-D-alanine ligase
MFQGMNQIRTGPNTALLHALLEKMKSATRIAVVHGGDKSAEGAVIHQTRNPRSHKSYAGVATDIANSLRRLGFMRVDLLAEDMRLGDQLRQLNTGLVWLNTGGTQGFSSICHAASVLEMVGMPYVGHNPLNSALLDNKHSFKYSLNGLKVNTPDFLVCDFKDPQQIEDVFSEFDSVFADAKYLVVKPVSGRASLHVHRVQGKQQARAMALQVHQATGNLVLIERFVSGSEYTIAVGGHFIARDRRLIELGASFTFSAVRRIMAQDEAIFTSMDIRPIGPDRCQVLDPTIDSKIIGDLSTLAKKIFVGFGLETMVRVDIRADENGRLFVLEANPKPDLKQPTESGFSFVTAGLHHQQMDYDDLILSILASRLHFLLTHRREMIPRIAELY